MNIPLIPNIRRIVRNRCRRRQVLGCLVILLVLALSQSLLSASSSQIHIEPDPPFFSPNQLTIPWKTPLAWVNHTGEAHSIVSDDCRSRSECPFDSGIIRPDHQFVLPHLAPGRYPYHCGLHSFMRGMITIQPSQPYFSDI